MVATLSLERQVGPSRNLNLATAPGHATELVNSGIGLRDRQTSAGGTMERLDAGSKASGRALQLFTRPLAAFLPLPDGRERQRLPLLPADLALTGKSVFSDGQQLGSDASHQGGGVGKGIAGVLTWGAKLLAEFLKLPARMIQIGADIINGLVGGLTEGWAKLSQSVGELATGIKDKFKSMLGIHSPSRVFMDFGLNIGEGAAQGITKALSGVQGAAGKMAGVALAGAVAASGHAVAGIKEAAQMLPAVQIGAPAAAGRGTANGQAMAGMSIQFAPNITIGGDAGGDVKGQVQQAMTLSLRELEQMMRRVQAEQQRRAF